MQSQNGLGSNRMGVACSIFGFIVMCLGCFVPLEGCTSTPQKDVVFKHSPPSILGQTIPARVKVVQFQTGLALGQAVIPEIGDIEELVTQKIVDDLRYCEVFSIVETTNDLDDADLVLNGKIKNLHYDCNTATGQKIAFVLAFGIIGGLVADHGQLADTSVKCAIEVTIKDPHSGHEVATYSGEGKLNERSNSCSCNGYELNLLLHKASSEIIKQIFADHARISEVVKKRKHQGDRRR